MSRRKSDRALDAKDVSREATLEALLDQLCVRFGFCLPPAAKTLLRTTPPKGAEAFTDAVIAADGMDPDAMDGSLRRRMVEAVELEAGRIL